MKSLSKISLCLTPEDIEAIDAARYRLGAHGLLRNRSEVVRLAIGYLEQLDDWALEATAARVRKLKPGRRPGG